MITGLTIIGALCAVLAIIGSPRWRAVAAGGLRRKPSPITLVPRTGLGVDLTAHGKSPLPVANQIVNLRWRING